MKQIERAASSAAWRGTWSAIAAGTAGAMIVAATAHAQSGQAAQPAQTSPAATNDSSSEIVVTAQRREQRLIDTPLAISAVSSADLAHRGFNNIVDLASALPNVQFKQGSGSVNQIISIRGSNQPNDALFFDQPVGMYIDGVYIAKSEGGLFDLGDIERIEVLRGPQGTLYGRNTLDGAVNVVTRKPDGHAEAIATGLLGNYEQQGARLTLASPWIGRLALRGTVDFRRHEGYIKNLPDPYGTPGALPPQTDRLNSENSISTRLAARYEASDNFTLDYAFDFSRQHNRQQYPVLDHFNHVDGSSRPVCVPGAAADPRYNCPAGSGGVPGLLDIFDPASPSYVGVDLTPYINTTRSLTSYIDQPQFERQRVFGNALTATLHLGPVELKSLTAYRTLRSSRNTDFDASPLDLINATLYNKFHSFSQEFQANASFDRVNVVSGLYYYSDSGTSAILQHVITPGFYDTSFDTGTRAYAAYAQADWTPAILDGRLTITGGVRYTHERKRTNRFFAVDTPGLPQFVLIDNVGAHASFSRATPMASISYKITPETNVYLRYASGFKSGGFSGQASSLAESTTPFKAETIDSYEAGLKARFLGGAVNVAAAVFYEKHRNQQINVAEDTGGALTEVIRNAGRSTSKGVEFEATVQPARPIKLGVTFGYLDAKFDEFLTTAGDQGGNRVVPFAPKYSVAVNADLLLAEMAFGNVRLHADYTYLTHQYDQAALLRPNLLSTDANDLPDARNDAFIPAYALVNGRLTLESVQIGGGTFDIALFGKNIFDRKYRTLGIPFGASFGGLTEYFYGPPRTYGIEVTARF